MIVEGTRHPIPAAYPSSSAPAPAVVIRCELGQPPLVVCEWDSDLDDQRVTAWLDCRPCLAALIVRAIELAEQERAA